MKKQIVLPSDPKAAQARGLMFEQTINKMQGSLLIFKDGNRWKGIRFQGKRALFTANTELEAMEKAKLLKPQTGIYIQRDINNIVFKEV